MNWPKVTVVIANKNYDTYVVSAIKSALALDYDKDKLEVFVVDDGSTDDSWENIYQFIFKEEHQKKRLGQYTMLERYYDGIKVRGIKLDTSVGPSEARNIIIEQTLNNTDAYLILDADDECYPNKLKRLAIEWMQAPHLIGAVYGDYDVYDVRNDVKLTEFKQAFDKKVLARDCIVHSGSLINKQALLKVKDQFGFYDREMRTCEDYDLWMRISEYFMIMHVAEPLTLVRVAPGNSTESVDNTVWQRNWQRVMEKAKARHG